MTTYSAITAGQIDAESYIDTVLAGQWANNLLAVIEGDASASTVRIAGDLAMTAITAGATYAFHASAPDYVISQTGSTYVSADINDPIFAGQSIIQRAGTYRVEWEMRETTAVGGSATGKVYVNGVAFGSELSVDSTTFGTVTENLTFAGGDVVQLYVRHTGGATVEVKNFKILGAVKPFG